MISLLKDFKSLFIPHLGKMKKSTKKFGQSGNLVIMFPERTMNMMFGYILIQIHLKIEDEIVSWKFLLQKAGSTDILAICYQI